MTNSAEILDYWFGNDPDDLQVIRKFRKLWFDKNELLDTEIRDRFGDLVEKCGRETGPDDSSLPARQRLAKIILFDQFPRNIYRGDPRSFAYDPLALALTLEGLTLHQDQQLRPVERAFFYLPLEHSEQLEHQNLSVELFRRLAASVPDNWKEPFDSFLDYADRHRQIIVSFGRFPHRNKILRRASTGEEREFLSQPNSSF